MSVKERVEEICRAAHNAQYALAGASAEAKNNMLRNIAAAISGASDKLIQINKKDLEAAKASGMSVAMLDRLTLTPERVASIAEGVAQVADLPDPVGEVTEEWTVPSGLHIKKVRVPLGVIGVIYESRPNVTADVAALCLKAGNCVVLRGGKEAINSNRAIYDIIAGALKESGFNPACVGFIDDTSREGSMALLKQGGLVDVVIPRGGDGLKHFVLDNAAMPVIASAGGVCHLFVEKSAKLDRCIPVIENAKMQRPSTCNALEQLLVQQDVAESFIPAVCKDLADKGCKIVACQKSKAILDKAGIAADLAKEEDFKREYSDYCLTVRVVKDTDEAISIINANNTAHSDGILSEDKAEIAKFVKGVDAACVYVNASTRFTDGFQFGFGAEIGISTQKLHARGPLGLKQLTSEKYIADGDYLSRK